MMPTASKVPEAVDPYRVLVLAPHGRDASLACRVLEHAAIAAQSCPDGKSLADEIRRGVGAVVATEEALTASVLAVLTPLVENQAPWSDLPFIVFSRGSGPPRDRTPAGRLEPLGNLTFVDRPVKSRTVITAV